jgi:hypothetical protein
MVNVRGRNRLTPVPSPGALAPFHAAMPESSKTWAEGHKYSSVSQELNTAGETLVLYYIPHGRVYSPALQLAGGDIVT